MIYLGDININDTIDFKFTTVDTTGVPSTLGNTAVVSSYFEQIFILDGWKEIFEMEDDIVYNLVDHKFHIPEFIEAVNHFLEGGCPHWLAQLAEQED